MTSRNWRVDSLRGYFLVIMTLAHLPPTPVQRLFSYTFGYASAPDGFVFLSGLVSTWVYLRVRNKRGQTALEARVLRRTRDVYMVHILLLIISIVGAVFLSHNGFQAAHPIQTFVSGSLLLYQPALSDILPMYCVFLLFTPLVLDQMMKGRAWLVGVVSVTLWFGAQLGFGDTSNVVPWISLGSFNILAWQAYFVTGQYLGYRSLRAEKEVVPKSRGLLAVCLVVALFFFLDRHREFLFGVAPLLKFSFSPSRNPARFVDAACLGYVIWWIPRTVDLQLMRLQLFKFFNLLGQHSLQVFAGSLLITAVFSKIGHYWVDLSGASRIGLALAAVASLAIPAWVHVMYRKRGGQRPTQRTEYPEILQARPVFLATPSLATPSVVTTSKEPA